MLDYDLMTSSSLEQLCKEPISTEGPIPRYHRLGLQNIFSGDMIHSITVAARPGNKGECLAFLIVPLPDAQGKGRLHNSHRTAPQP